MSTRRPGPRSCDTSGNPFQLTVSPLMLESQLHNLCLRAKVYGTWCKPSAGMSMKPHGGDGTSQREPAGFLRSRLDPRKPEDRQRILRIANPQIEILLRHNPIIGFDGRDHRVDGIIQRPMRGSQRRGCPLVMGKM